MMTHPTGIVFLLLFCLLVEQNARGQDWKGIEIPAVPPEEHRWLLSPISDDFQYDAEPARKPRKFTQRWRDSFINPWLGPGLTELNPHHSYVKDGHLAIHANRKPNTDKVLTGCISSLESVRFPAFVEARVKISGMVLASNVWMLSADSTQEIDIIEAYGSQRDDQAWTAKRIHLSHHVFIRKPFQDYQPTDEGSWHYREQGWRDDFHRVGVYWRDPWHLEYYVDGKLVRTVSGREQIDPKGFTQGKGLNKPMQIIINAEDQDWRSDQGVTPSDLELGDLTKSIMWVDWIRLYSAKKD